MKDQDNNISVKILDKIYHVKCPIDKAQELQEAAAYVDKEMRIIRDSGKVAATDRIAVITALNIAYNLLSSGKEDHSNNEQTFRYIQKIKNKVETILGQQELFDFPEKKL